MAFDHKDYIRSFLMVPGQNGAAAYGVSIVPATVAKGQPYFRVIGVHHLTGSENGGKNNIFLDVLNEQGQRTGPPWSLVDWKWEGMRPGERAGLVVLDKPAGEPGGNIALHAGQIASVWIPGRASDVVTGLQTAGIDAPDEGPGNHRYHHSFYVVWQRVTAGEPDPEQPPVEEPPPAPDLTYTITSATRYTIAADGKPLAQTVDQAAARRIVAGLKLLAASERDHRAAAYVEGLRGLAKDEQ